MHYVYVLKSLSDNERFYVGITSNLKRRLEEHNKGESIHTNKFKPWAIKTYIAFDEKHKAVEFERYLKSGNGRIFMKKRF